MKRTLVSLAAIGALALTGCGSDDGTATTTESSAAASESAKPTAKVGDTLPAKELGERTEAAMKKAGTVKMTSTSDGEDISGEMSYTDGLAYKLSGMNDGELMELVYVDTVLYLGGEGVAEMSGGKKFIKIDPEGDDMMSQMMAPLLGVVEQAANPSSLLSNLDGVESTVVAVDGDQTTYETKLTADQLRKATEQMVGTELPAEAAAEIEAATVRQTVDAEGRLVKVVTTGGSDMTMTYSDHGAPVDVSAPAASDVGTFDLNELMKDDATP